MSFARVYGAQASLLSGDIISVEVDLARGLHAFTLVGLPDKAVEESRDRVSAAIKNSGFESPKSKNQKVVISLAPADMKKEGPLFDVPIALAYLRATGDVSFDPEHKVFIGELSLDGEIRPVRGALPIARSALASGMKELYVPGENAEEAALVEGISIIPIQSLRQLVAHLRGEDHIHKMPHTSINYQIPEALVSLEDIRGQSHAKRALEIAAAGGHNISLYGPPGTGKTMLAKALCAILPPLSFESALEATAIHSVAGTLTDTLITHPPFRSPHHTSSHISLVGGGAIPKPGEVTLAHTGVLFLDEFPEFERRVIDALRQPLEDRVIHISRAKGSMVFPARIMLVASMNPCPCGNFGSTKICVCTPQNLIKYQKKISGPIADRIDLWVEVGHIPHEMLRQGPQQDQSRAETNQTRLRIAKARALQQKRFKSASASIETNAEMSPKNLTLFISLSGEAEEALRIAAKKLDLSPRAYHRVLKVAQTIADLEESPRISTEHIVEALQYRPKQGSPGAPA